MTKKEIKKRVKINELEDRFMAKKILDKYSNEKYEHDYTVSAMTYGCHYDIVGEDRFQVNYSPYIAEIKQNTTNPKYKVKAIIKQKKVEDVLQASNGRKCYFISLLDGKYGYIFDMNNINWDNVEIKLLRQKKTQVDDDSKYEIVPTYFISYNKAFYKCDISKFYKEYALLTKEQKENYLPKA